MHGRLIALVQFLTSQDQKIAQASQEVFSIAAVGHEAEIQTSVFICFFQQMFLMDLHNVGRQRIVHIALRSIYRH
jgi:hypothetical protein